MENRVDRASQKVQGISNPFYLVSQSIPERAGRLKPRSELVGYVWASSRKERR